MAETILLVDDKPDEIQFEIERELVGTELELEIEPIPGRALERLKEDYNIRYLILDLVFEEDGLRSDVQGPKIFEEIHGRRPRLPIIILSSYAGGNYLKRVKSNIVNPRVLRFLDKNKKHLWDIQLREFLSAIEPEPRVVDSASAQNIIKELWNEADRQGGRSVSIVSALVLWKQAEVCPPARIKFTQDGSVEGEVHFYKSLSGTDFAEYFPKLLHENVSTKGEKGGPFQYYVMEDVVGSPLLAQLFEREPHWARLAHLQRDILSFFEKFHTSRIDDIPPDLYVLYVKTMEDKLNEICAYRPWAKQVVECEKINVNGRDLENWPALLPILKNEIEAIRPPFSARVHGDPHYRNVLVVKGGDNGRSSTAFKLIDPKGLTTSDYLYDYGKLFQPISGHGHVDASHRRLSDQMHFEMIERSVRTNTYLYDFMRPNMLEIRKYLMASFLEHLERVSKDLDDPSWAKRFLLAIGRHYVAASSFFETPNEFLVLYCEGIRYLNKLIESLPESNYGLSELKNVFGVNS